MSKIGGKKMGKKFGREITHGQYVDTGMAAVLICLLFAYFGQSRIGLVAAIFLLIANMVHPALFRLPAILWFGLSKILGTAVSGILLSVIFFVLVTPVGIVRRAFGADPLQLKRWKSDDTSLFQIRDHQFNPKELEKPY